MRNKIIIAICFAFSLSFMSSCDNDFDKINSNPNSPEVVPTNTIFNSATKEYTDFARDDFNTGRLTLPWMQYWGQTAYADEDRYQYRETTAQGLYENTYRVATDLKTVIDLNVNPATRGQMSAYGSNDNQIAASRIILSYMFHGLADFFGDIPYYSYGSNNADFQALDVNNVLSPKFADSRAIYTDILSELRAASDMIDTTKPVFTSGDNIFGGDAVKWKKFANSLILRVANRLRDVDATAANTAINAAITAGVFTSNADNAIQAYESQDATGSPFWNAFIGRTDFAVAAPFVKLLKGDVSNFGPDARLFQMAAPISASIGSVKDGSYTTSTDYDDYIGVPYAYPRTNTLAFTDYSFGSSNVIKPDYGEVLMEYAEVQFIISEHNSWNQTNYENGVRASMERWGVASATVTTFVNRLPAASEENVLTQKYVALYMQAHEAWAEYRRTGYPNNDVLVLPGEQVTLPANQVKDDNDASTDDTIYIFESLVADLTDLPTRLSYPVILQTLNGDNRAAAVTKLGDDKIDTKLFWDVD